MSSARPELRPLRLPREPRGGGWGCFPPTREPLGVGGTFLRLITHSTAHQGLLVGRSHSSLPGASMQGTCCLAWGGVVS